MCSSDRQEAVIAIHTNHLHFLNGFNKILVSEPDNDFLEFFFKADLEGALITPDHLLPVI